MGRKKKRKKALKNPSTSKKADTAFNPLKGNLTAMREISTHGEVPSSEISGPKTAPEPDDASIFLDALSDVTPISDSKVRVPKNPDPDLKPEHAPNQEELEALAHLSDLVSGNAEMDITFTDEYIEGAITGVGQKLIQRLKKGQFPVQDYVDLHGLTKSEAELRVHEFLIQSYRLGLRCVLIVHGKGLNSKDNIPVLKERLPIWLSRSPVKKIVLAFSTAMPYDGGTGAVYVLLKRHQND